jgi:hypothetical protein
MKNQKMQGMSGAGTFERNRAGDGEKDWEECGQTNRPNGPNGRGEPIGRFHASIASIASIAALWLGTGCSSVHSPHPVHATGPGSAPGAALMCDRCQTTWVLRPEGAGRWVRYTRQKAMVCPDCESAVETWWKTGQFKHSCSRCKGRLTCEPPREP